MYGLFSSERIIKIRFDSENHIQENVSSKIISQISHSLTGEIRDLSKPLNSNFTRDVANVKHNLSANTFTKLIKKLRKRNAQRTI